MNVHVYIHTAPCWFHLHAEMHEATINWSASCGLSWFLYSALPSGLLSGPDTFVLITTSMTWPEAQSYCREHHTDLASVRNMEDNARLSTVINGEFVWIGLSRDGWKWSDGSDSSFRNWNPNELVGLYTKSCLSVDFSADGQWESLDCNVKSAFICYSGELSFTHTLHVDFWMFASFADHIFFEYLQKHEELWKMTILFYLINQSFKHWCWLLSVINVVTDDVVCFLDIVVSKRVVKVRLEKSSSSLDLKDPVVMEDLLKKVHLPLISNRTTGGTWDVVDD